MLTPETRILKLSPRHEETINQAVTFVSSWNRVGNFDHLPMNSTRGTAIRSARSQREAIVVQVTPLPIDSSTPAPVASNNWYVDPEVGGSWFFEVRRAPAPPNFSKI
jgi:hypothetical protein